MRQLKQSSSGYYIQITERIPFNIIQSVDTVLDTLPHHY